MLSFDLRCPYRLLSGYLDYAIDNAFGPEKYETHGVSLNLVRRGDSFLNIDGNVIFVNAIADIEVFKDVGLFSTEIKGVIDVSIAVEYEISSQFKLHTKSQILLHKWVEKPKLEIGHLNMPVEKLVELALKHYEGIITAKLDAAIQEKVDIRSIVYGQVAALNKELLKKSFHGVSFNVVPTELQIEKPKYIDSNVLIKGGIVLDSNISTGVAIDKPEITFAWIEKI